MLFNWIKKIFSSIFSRPNTITTTSTLTTTPRDNKKKVALCVGINKYPNPANNLNGCVNDANDFADFFRNTHKFDRVETLFDDKATYKTVTNKIKEIIKEKPDVFVYTNSGHGTRVIDKTGTEMDGYAEAICLYDKILLDKDFHKILKDVDPNSHTIIIADTCHSANVTRSFLSTMNDMDYISIPKYLPPEDDMDALEMSMTPISRAIFQPIEDMHEVLLAAAKSDQYAYDAYFNGRPNGAFTYYALQILKRNLNTTYLEFINEIKKHLPSHRYPQVPVCEANSNMKKTVIFS